VSPELVDFLVVMYASNNSELESHEIRDSRTIGEQFGQSGFHRHGIGCDRLGIGSGGLLALCGEQRQAVGRRDRSRRDRRGRGADRCDRAPSTFPERPVGCSGALCSGQPAPVSTATLIDLHRVGNWAILSIPTPATVLEAASSPHDERVLLPISRGTSVDHPPRLSFLHLAL
jgi:hypothetical protein